ncbi:MAG TPA: type II toxin-antitoxin system VapC family toxin [Gammaproteobacteria bacterium]|nr:type II toxin-antitoxin system VapC family toxin [Gammaproteobacteria bacterium]
MRYLLDTNIVSDLVRHPQGAAACRLVREGVESSGLSIVVASEIRFGLAKSTSPQLAERLLQILEQFKVLPLEAPADEHYADIRNALERAGTPIGPNDLLIAAHARALGLVLVTDNLREFSRVRDLQLENWVA